MTLKLTLILEVYRETFFHQPKIQNKARLLHQPMQCWSNPIDVNAGQHHRGHVAFCLNVFTFSTTSEFLIQYIQIVFPRKKFQKPKTQTLAVDLKRLNWIKYFWWHNLVNCESSLNHQMNKFKFKNENLKPTQNQRKFKFEHFRRLFQNIYADANEIYN